MGRLYMDPLDCPFRGTAEVLAKYRLGASVQAIVADIHAEASSEKMAYGHIFDGQMSFVVGTHTHCPTADAQILPGGTAFQSDAGMCGDYDSVIGMVKKRRNAAVLAQDAGRKAGTRPKARPRSAACSWKPTTSPGWRAGSSRCASAAAWPRHMPVGLSRPPSPDRSARPV